MKTVMTIAGSDPGGGAGIQADLKTFSAFQVFGTTAITAITVQNTVGVQEAHPVPPELVAKQAEAVLSDLGADAVKTGMLHSPDLVRAVADLLRRHAPPHIVVDPVMVATSGHSLLEEEGPEVLKSEILPLCEVVTPNLSEAALLVGFAVETPEDMRRAARALIRMGPRYALVKGGHLKENPLDLLYDGDRFIELCRPRIDTKHTHGTGCTLSSALAACLALGADMENAFRSASNYVRDAILTAPGLGRGKGPLNHAHVPVLTFERNDPP